MFSMNLDGPRLGLATIEDPRWKVRYGVGSVMQIGPTECLLIANRRVLGHAIVDFEDGADAFVFDRLDQIDADRAIPLTRNEEAVHPDTGEALMMVSHCSTGGFVPRHALGADGKPHSAAGTGFVLATSVGHSAALNKPRLDHRTVLCYQVILQLRYDGSTLAVTGRRRIEPGAAPLGYDFIRHALQNAIPDGDDLLGGLTVAPIDRSRACIPCDHPHAHGRHGRNRGSGLCRWRYGPEGWYPADFVPVTGPDLSFEASLVRDRHGALLMSVRGKGSDAPPGEVYDGLENTYEHLRVYRSSDNGQTWEKAIHAPRERCATPITINRTAGGLLYLAGNPYASQPDIDSRGRSIMCTRRRTHLACWPLAADRRGVEAPVRIVDGVADFGPPQPLEHPRLQHDNVWCIDHPMGSAYRLRDGTLKSLLAFRVTDAAANACGIYTSPATGLYVGEIHVENDPPPAPAWRFADEEECE